MEARDIVILGGGMAGFGAVHRLRQEGLRPALFEKSPYLGGAAASFSSPDGFVFDQGGHVSFSRNERIRDLFAANVNQEYGIIKAQVNNHWRGYWIKHPAQCNLHGLPTDLTTAIICDFVKARDKGNGEVCNYAEWLEAAYGRTFAETFPGEYARKYHTTDARNMSTTWLSGRFYRPTLEEVLRGALSPETPDFHYVTNCRYPRCNGFVSYLRPLFDCADVHTSHELVRLDPIRRTLYFACGATRSYDLLISSIPLPELVPMIDGAPQDVIGASLQLACTTCVLVNLGVDRSDISTVHWSYFYDHDLLPARMNFPHMLSANNAPSGHGSIQVEVYYSRKYKPLDRTPDDCIEPVIADLRRCGLIYGDDRIVFSEARLIPYANIIFDHDRDAAFAKIRRYLDAIGIACCGRYGEWGYLWTDESFVSGENAAQSVLDSVAERL